MKKSSRKTSTSKHAAAAKLESYFNERHEALSHACSQARKNFSVERIHDLRVEVKKLRALFRLVESISPDFDANARSKALKRLFKAAGVLRDIDIMQAIVSGAINNHELSEFYNYLKQQELVQRRKFLSDSQAFKADNLKVVANKISWAPRETPTEELISGMRTRFGLLSDKVMKLTHERSQSKAKLHKIRKLAKETRYALDLWQYCDKTVATTIAAAGERLKSVYGDLGDWRDTVLTVAAVSSFIGGKASRKLIEKRAYVRFLQALKKQETFQLKRFKRSSQSLEATLLAMQRKSNRRTTNNTRVRSISRGERLRNE